MHTRDEGRAGDDAVSGGEAGPRATRGGWARRALGVLVAPKLIAFLVLTLGMGWYLLSDPRRDFHWDSGMYWALGKRFFTPDGWTLDGYNNALRPYFFPMLLSWVQGMARWRGWDPVLLFRALSAVNFGLLCGVVAPAFVERLWGRRVALVRILAFGGLVFLFWRGHFLYPLTDFPSVMLWMLAIYFVLPRTPGAKQAWWWFVIAGVALAAAFYSRPSYQVGLALLVFVALRRVFAGSGRGWRMPARLALMAVGIAVVAMPQVSVNKRLKDETSMFVSSEGLFLWQLRWGLLLNRYETNVGEDLAFPDVGFVDHQGVRLFADRGMQHLGQIDSYGTYFGMVADDPAAFASIYARRVYSGMDVWFTSTYIEGEVRRSVWLGVVTYSLWFVFGCLVWRALREPRAAGLRFDAAGALVLFVAPVGLAVPSAVEPRFFLPAHLVVYGVVCFALPWPGVRGAVGGLVSRRAAPVWVMYAVVLVVCNMVSSWMFSALLPSKAHEFLRTPLMVLPPAGVPADASAAAS